MWAFPVALDRLSAVPIAIEGLSLKKVNRKVRKGITQRALRTAFANLNRQRRHNEKKKKKLCVLCGKIQRARSKICKMP